MIGFKEALAGGSIPLWVIFAIIVIALWSTVWKIFALWKAARKSSWPWFLVLFFFNTIGILEILYIYVFSDMRKKKKK